MLMDLESVDKAHHRNVWQDHEVAAFWCSQTSLISVRIIRDEQVYGQNQMAPYRSFLLFESP